MTLSTAYRAACASGDPSVVILDTVELYHPDWPSIIRLVADRTDLTATLEATAPNNPGASVLFTAFPMQVDMPRTGDGPQDGSVVISNATRLVMAILEAADLSDAVPIRVIWRPYVSTDLTGPGINPPLRMAVKSISADGGRVTFQCGPVEFANRRFPRPSTGVYKTTMYPGLTERI